MHSNLVTMVVGHPFLSVVLLNLTMAEIVAINLPLLYGMVPIRLLGHLILDVVRTQ
jgi:hypothetical protein